VWTEVHDGSEEDAVGRNMNFRLFSDWLAISDISRRSTESGDDSYPSLTRSDMHRHPSGSTMLDTDIPASKVKLEFYVGTNLT
jgi:hypothetical protein